jgi:tyrosine-specific transport protein
LYLLLLCVVLGAGTYGVLTLFGILPAAMAWQSRYGSQQQEQGQEQGQQQGPGAQSCQPLLPGGAPVLIAVGGAAGAVIAHEVVGLLHLS